MKIAFSKVSTSPKQIVFGYDGLTLNGELFRCGYNQAKLDATLSGSIALVCDRCGKEYIETIDQPFTITLSGEQIESKDDLDIIEFLNGEIDVEYIIRSEHQAIEGAFHYCDACIDTQETLEIEI